MAVKPNTINCKSFKKTFLSCDCISIFLLETKSEHFFLIQLEIAGYDHISSI